MQSLGADRRGTGGQIRVGYGVAAELLSWILEPIGPGLYRLTATVAQVRPAMLAFSPLTISIPVGALLWSWTLEDGGVGVEGETAVAIVQQPRVGPLRS